MRKISLSETGIYSIGACVCVYVHDGRNSRGERGEAFDAGAGMSRGNRLDIAAMSISVKFSGWQ